MTVVVDTSLAIKWVVPEEHTEDALTILNLWKELEETLIAPPLFRSEVTNALHQQVRQRQLTRSEASDALGSLLSRIAISEPAGLYARALTLAGELFLGSTYDAMYLALAESEGCEMWTADERFIRSAQPQFPQIRWLGEEP